MFSAARLHEQYYFFHLHNKILTRFIVCILKVFDTIPNDSNELVVTGSYELLAVCLYVTLHLILPVLLTVNHMSPFFLSIATIPVLISCKGNCNNTFIYEMLLPNVSI